MPEAYPSVFICFSILDSTTYFIPSLTFSLSHSSLILPAESRLKTICLLSEIEDFFQALQPLTSSISSLEHRISLILPVSLKFQMLVQFPCLRYKRFYLFQFMLVLLHTIWCAFASQPNESLFDLPPRTLSSPFTSTLVLGTSPRGGGHPVWILAK